MTPLDPLSPLLALPGVEDAVTVARASVDRLLGHRVLRRSAAAVAAEAGLRCARASAELEGTGVEGALRLSAELASLVPVLRSAPPQAFARMHVLAVPADDAGRPVSGDAAVRLRLLAETLAATTAPAVVVAAVAHGELLTVAPFGEGSGLVARAASRALLAERGLDPSCLSAPDVGHARGGYREAAAAYASGDVQAWLLHCASAVEYGAMEGLAICEAIGRA